jgi:hypothetical protein
MRPLRDIRCIESGESLRGTIREFRAKLDRLQNQVSAEPPGRFC